jgi:hypothetical protein
MMVWQPNYSIISIAAVLEEMPPLHRFKKSGHGNIITVFDVEEIAQPRSRFSC